MPNKTSNNTQVNSDDIPSVYFTEQLPWQQQTWQTLTQSYHLPHALLFAGVSGLGKRQLVWQFVAFLLCHQPERGRACGSCQSCRWLGAGTHPDLKVLPHSSLPTAEDVDKATSIKIDDIRELTPFLAKQSDTPRICVLDNAETMTTAAANALLKSLEEPVDNVYFLLITDAPARLLPTILSRVQRVAINAPMTPNTIDYLQNQLQMSQQANEVEISNELILQALNSVQHAPLAALKVLQSTWYAKRELWLKTWHALRQGKRSVVAASDYWQGEVDLMDFVTLSQLMLSDVNRVRLRLPAIQQDLDWQAYPFITDVSQASLHEFGQIISDTQRSKQQNVQDKLSYDKLMQAFAQC